MDHFSENSLPKTTEVQKFSMLVLLLKVYGTVNILTMVMFYHLIQHRYLHMFFFHSQFTVCMAYVSHDYCAFFNEGGWSLLANSMKKHNYIFSRIICTLFYWNFIWVVYDAYIWVHKKNIKHFQLNLSLIKQIMNHSTLHQEQEFKDRRLLIIINCLEYLNFRNHQWHILFTHLLISNIYLMFRFIYSQFSSPLSRNDL